MNKFLVFLTFFLSMSVCFADTMIDEVANKLPTYPIKPKIYTDYNFESTVKIPVNLKILEEIRSESDIYEGQIVKFKVVRDVVYKEKTIIPRGTIVLAKVSVIITSGMNGIPASVIFRDFKIKQITVGQLSDSFEVFGQDRSLLVFPLKWALTPLPPTGTLTNFIKGGHVKVKRKTPITLYYYPEWK